MNDHTSACASPFTGLVCFLAGGVAGAGLALLLAPQSGRVARERIQRRFSATAGSARDLGASVMRRGEKLRAEAELRVSEAASALAGNGGAKLPG